MRRGHHLHVDVARWDIVVRVEQSARVLQVRGHLRCHQAAAVGGDDASFREEALDFGQGRGLERKVLGETLDYHPRTLLSSL